MNKLFTAGLITTVALGIGIAYAAVHGSKTITGSDFTNDVTVSVINNVVNVNASIPSDVNWVNFVSINPITNSVTIQY